MNGLWCTWEDYRSYRAGNHLQKWITTYAPDFCWLTATDLIAMYEIEHDEFSEESFRITLWRLAKRGILKTRKMPGSVSLWGGRRGPHPIQYIRAK